jgi:hypothetical protein
MEPSWNVLGPEPARLGPARASAVTRWMSALGCWHQTRLGFGFVRD